MKIGEFLSDGHYQAFLPDDSLSHLVNRYWIFDLNRKAANTKEELLLPRLRPEIIFRYGVASTNTNVQSRKVETMSSSIVRGIQQGAYASKRCDLTERLFMVGIELKPIGLYHLLSCPLVEVANKRIPINDFGINTLNILEQEISEHYHQPNTSKILIITDCGDA